MAVSHRTGVDTVLSTISHDNSYIFYEVANLVCFV